MIRKMRRRASLKRGGGGSKHNKNKDDDGGSSIGGGGNGVGVKVRSSRSLGTSSMPPRSASSPDRRPTTTNPVNPSSPGGGAGDAATVMTASTSATATTTVAANVSSGGGGGGVPAFSVVVPEKRRRRAPAAATSSPDDVNGGTKKKKEESSTTKTDNKPKKKKKPQPPPPKPRRKDVDDDGDGEEGGKRVSSSSTTAVRHTAAASSSSLTSRRAALRLRSEVRDAQRLILSPRQPQTQRQVSAGSSNNRSLVLSPLQSPTPGLNGGGDNSNRDSAFRLTSSAHGNGDGRKGKDRQGSPPPSKLRLDWSNDSGENENDETQIATTGVGWGGGMARLESARAQLLSPTPGAAGLVKRSNSQSSAATASITPSQTSSRRSGGSNRRSSLAKKKRSSPSYRLLEGMSGLAQNLVVLESTSGIGVGVNGGGGGVSVLDDLANLRCILDDLMPFQFVSDEDEGRGGGDWLGGAGGGVGDCGAAYPPTPGVGTPRKIKGGKVPSLLGRETSDGTTAGSSFGGLEDGGTTLAARAAWRHQHRGRDSAPHVMAGRRGGDVRQEILMNASRLIDCASEEVASLTMVRGGGNTMSGLGPPSSPPRRAGRRRFRTDMSMGTGTYRFMILVLADGARLVRELMDGTDGGKSSSTMMSPRQRSRPVVTSCVSLARSSPVRLSATAAAERLKVLPPPPPNPRTPPPAPATSSTDVVGPTKKPPIVPPRPPSMPPPTPSTAAARQQQLLLNDRLKAVLEWSSNVDSFVQQRQGEGVGSAIVLDVGLLLGKDEGEDEAGGVGNVSTDDSDAVDVVKAIQPGVFLVDPMVAADRNAEVLAAIIRSRGVTDGGTADDDPGGDSSVVEDGSTDDKAGVDDEESQRRVSAMVGVKSRNVRGDGSALTFLARLRRHFVAAPTGVKGPGKFRPIAATMTTTMVVGLGLLFSTVQRSLSLFMAALLFLVMAGAASSKPMLGRKFRRKIRRLILLRWKDGATTTATSPRRPEPSVPKLPAGYLPRPTLRDDVVDALLVGGGTTGGARHVVVVHGENLTGRSTLAAMVADDPRVRGRFDGPEDSTPARRWWHAGSGGGEGDGGLGGGIAWVSLEREAITYSALNDIYADVCRQLGVDLVGSGGECDGCGSSSRGGSGWGWHAAIPPEDESDSIALMEEMRVRMGRILRGHNDFRRRRRRRLSAATAGRGRKDGEGDGGSGSSSCLLVLDNLYSPGDVRWFSVGAAAAGRGGGDEGGDASRGGTSCPCQLLITTHTSNLRQVRESLGGGGGGGVDGDDCCRSVEVGRLSDREALALLQSAGGCGSGHDLEGNGSGSNGAMLDVLRACENLPPALRLVSRICLEDLSWRTPTPSPNDADLNVTSHRWDVLALHLSPSSSSPGADAPSPSGEGEGAEIEGGSSAAQPAIPPAHHRLLERGLRCACGDASTIIELCFSAFLIVFGDDPHCDDSLTRPTIPVRVANLLWEELLVKSDLVTNAHILALERMLSTFQQRSGGASSSSTDASRTRIFTRSAVIRNRLEAIGVIQTISKEEKRGTGPSGYSIKYDSIHLNESCFAPSHIHDGELAQNHRMWNGYLVSGYEKMVRTGLHEHPRNTNTQEDRYFLRWLPLHMIRAGLLEKACTKLIDREFIRDRFDALGYVSGTRHHLLDARSLLDHVRNRGRYGDGVVSYDTSNNSKTMSVTVARGHVILAFERICDLLLSKPTDITDGVDDYSPPAIEVGMCLYALGHELQRNGWRSEAFAFHQEALHTVMSVRPRTEEELRYQSRLLSRISYSLGGVFESKRDRAEAVRSYQEALHFASSSEEEAVSNRDVARINYRLGCVHIDDGEFVEAVKALNESLRAGQSVYGLYHEDIARTMQKLAECEIAMENWEEALILLADSLQVRTSMGLGSNDATVGSTLHTMGEMQRKLGRTDEAVQSYTEALRIRRKILGKQHIDYAESLHSLGDALQEHGSLSDALTAFVKALNIRRKVLGENHVDVATTLHNMGYVQFEMGRYDDALGSYQRALQIRKVVLGDQHKDFARTLHNIGVVHREMGDTDRAIDAFTEALWIAKELNVNAPSGSSIVERVEALFGHDVIDSGNASSRIFGCVSLMVDRILSKEGHSDPPSVEKKTNDHEPAARVLDWINPLLPLLKAYVNAESVIMGAERDDELGDEDEEAAGTRLRKVQFCAYDFSCVSPPVDMNIGSHAHLERSIEALDNAMNQMKLLTSTTSSTGSVRSNLEIAKILLVIHAMASASEGGHLRSACAKAMERGGIGVWPASRFIRAAEVYKAEFEAIAAHLETRSDDQSYECSLVTPLKYRLGSCIGSAMRFHLRRLFDYPPMGYTLPSDDHPFTDFSGCRACTYEVVTMCPPEKIPSGDEPKLWEGAISVVFNLALRHIYSYLSSSDTIKTVFVTKNALDSSSTTFFSITDASRRCLARSSVPLSDDDIEDVMFDIDLARVALAASRAATFLMELLRWPGVEDAIQESGGWGGVESIANIIVRHELANDCPEEAHFALLKDLDELKDLLNGELENLSCAAQASKKFLQHIWSRFKRAGFRKRIKNENESIIRRALVDGSAMPIFPELGHPPMQ